MNKTYIPKAKQINRIWYLADAKDQILGRLAVRVARILRGKHKPDFCSHMDTGDGVIIINASKIKVTGRKLKQKSYLRYSGYPGGLRAVILSDFIKKKPQVVVKLAIKRMLPKGSLGRKIFRKLKVYSGEVHPHIGQNPKIIKL